MPQAEAKIHIGAPHHNRVNQPEAGSMNGFPPSLRSICEWSRAIREHRGGDRQGGGYRLNRQSAANTDMF